MPSRRRVQDWRSRIAAKTASSAVALTRVIKPQILTMKNSSLRIFGALGGAFVLFGANVFAQAVGPEAGLIGKRYAGADFSYDQFSGSSVDQAMGAAAVVNLPLNPMLDLMVGYSYSDTSGTNFGAIDKALTGSLLTHRNTEYGTGYFVGTLGHLWTDVNRAGVGATENGAFWSLRAGYEIGVGARTAVNLSFTYADGFDRDNVRADMMRYAAEVNHWFSRDVAGVAGVSYRQLKSSPDPVSYSLGLRWAF
jgi:hypothetical protein